MTTEDNLKKLEERLTRLEATLAPPSAGASAAGWTYYPRSPVVDPAPWWPGGAWGHPRWPWPNPIVDPVPWPGPVVDPAPWGWGRVPIDAVTAVSLGRIGPTGGDPPPIDVSRMSAAQLEATLHSINAEKARLSSMETMIKQQMDKLKKQG